MTTLSALDQVDRGANPSPQREGERAEGDLALPRRDLGAAADPTDELETDERLAPEPTADTAAVAVSAPEPMDPERMARLARDRKLVGRLQEGDPRAFQELVLTYQDRIFGLVYRMVSNRQEAEDIAQEVFLSVHRAIAGYRGEGQLYTWLYRIAINTTRNRVKYLKSRNFHRASDVDETPQAHLVGGDGGAVKPLQSVVPGPEQAVEGHRLQKVIQRELAALDEEHRVLIVLRDVQGLAYQDIVRITGLPEGTLKSRLHRARLALKARVEPYLT